MKEDEIYCKRQRLGRIFRNKFSVCKQTLANEYKEVADEIIKDKRLTKTANVLIEKSNEITIIYCLYERKGAMRFLENLKQQDGCSIVGYWSENSQEAVTVIYMGKDKQNKAIYKFYNEQIGIINIFSDDFMKGRISLSNYADMNKVREWQKHFEKQQKKNRDTR